jgi:putative transposase
MARGALADNVFVERLWRSVKYEEVYLNAYDNVSAARASIGSYLGSFMQLPGLLYNVGVHTRALTA